MAIFVSGDNDQVKSPTIKESTGGTSGRTAVPGSHDGAAVDFPEVASSVTRNLLNPKIVNGQLLLCGIDTLDLGLYVSWDDNWENTKQLLEEKKIASQSTTGILDKTDLDREFLHLPSGKRPNYRFQILFPEYRIYLSGSDRLQKTPNVYVSILAATLWHKDLDDITALLELDLAHFGGNVIRIKPSRLDLCADFKLSSPLDLQFLEQFKVTRSRMFKTFHNGNELESYYCGAADSPVQIRIYDKGKEIQASNKQWFLNLWNIKDSACVWRIEYQLRRSFLKQMKVNDLDSLKSNLGAIWHYLTAEWFSLRLLDDDKAERRTIHPLWLAVQQAGVKFGQDNGIRRSYAADEILSVGKILPHVLGRMISIAALSGISDRKESMINLFNLLEKSCDDDKFNNKYREKLIKLGYRGKLGGKAMNPNDTLELMTVEQFAERLQVSRTTVFYWLKNGELLEGVHFFRLGRIIRFRYEESLFFNSKLLKKPTTDKAKELIRPKGKKPAPAPSRQAINLDY